MVGNKPEKIIFLDEGGTIRAPMAATIASEKLADVPVEVAARGLTVLFPEPMNQKVEAVLISNSLPVEGYVAQEIRQEDFTPGAVCFVMERQHKRRLLGKLNVPDEDAIIVLNEFVGQELEVVNPCGAPVQTYGLCYESLEGIISTIIERIWG